MVRQVHLHPYFVYGKSEGSGDSSICPYSHEPSLLDNVISIKIPFAGSYGPRCEKTCLRVFANNTGADQPVHPRSLISAFVNPFLESTICKLATGEIPIF